MHSALTWFHRWLSNTHDPQHSLLPCQEGQWAWGGMATHVHRSTAALCSGSFVTDSLSIKYIKACCTTQRLAYSLSITPSFSKSHANISRFRVKVLINGNRITKTAWMCQSWALCKHNKCFASSVLMLTPSFYVKVKNTWRDKDHLVRHK